MLPMFKKLILCLVFVFPLMAEMKVMAFAGSTRNDSYNKKLLLEAVEMAKKMGASVTVVDLRDYPMPFYNADLETKEGMPTKAKEFRRLMIKHEGFIIASPEYNGSIPAILKNLIDWTSRGEKGNYSPEAYEGKKFAIMSASPGKGGGARALAHLRQVIEAISGNVVDQQVSVPEAHKAFNANGKLITDALKDQLQKEIQELLKKSAS
jgi:chromate reductase, NAD(P)H dehydrogenase (quinone)